MTTANDYEGLSEEDKTHLALMDIAIDLCNIAKTLSEITKCWEKWDIEGRRKQ